MGIYKKAREFLTGVFAGAVAPRNRNPAKGAASEALPDNSGKKRTVLGFLRASRLNRIRYKLIVAFSIPLILIIALGLLSYGKASASVEALSERAALDALKQTGRSYLWAPTAQSTIRALHLSGCSLISGYSPPRTISPC